MFDKKKKEDQVFFVASANHIYSLFSNEKWIKTISDQSKLGKEKTGFFFLNARKLTKHYTL